MIRAHQLIAVVRAYFRLGAPQTLAGLCAYGAYLAWLAMREIDTLGDAAYIHLYAALATAGAWVGACVGRAARWSGSLFTPSFVSTLGIVATFTAVTAFGLNGVTARVGGLDLWPLATFGTLALAAGLVTGCTWPSLSRYFFLSLAALVPAVPLLDPHVALPIHGTVGAVLTTVALATATTLFVRLAYQLRTPGVSSLSHSSPPQAWWPATAMLLRTRLWEPSMRRVAVVSGMLAAGCTFAHRLPAFEWRDGPLIVVIGSVCANLGAAGTSASLPRGPLPGTSWLVLSGVANTRSDAARRMLWRIIADSLFAAGVFTAVAIALGPDWQLVEMMLVALAACHAYLATACNSRWLLSSRLSVLVATPVVVAIAGAVWAFGPWGLPAALAACLITAVGAVYVGGLGMARIDLDPAPYAEAAG